MGEILRPSRFSGADWATELKEIGIIGVGGIGSWLSLSLSRIGHELILIDGDIVDETNVHGGQLFKQASIGHHKPQAVEEVCRDFGCINPIMCVNDMYNYNLHGRLPIVITGLDNMATRKQVFEGWKKDLEMAESKQDYLFIDGRLLMELYEVFTIEGTNLEAIKEYEEKWLFDDTEIPEADCTTKQSSFAAMGIASLITSILCNWLTNRKLDMDFREVPFHMRAYCPTLDFKKEETIKNGNITKTEESKEQTSEAKILTSTE